MVAISPDFLPQKEGDNGESHAETRITLVKGDQLEPMLGNAYRL